MTIFIPKQKENERILVLTIKELTQVNGERLALENYKSCLEKGTIFRLKYVVIGSVQECISIR